MAVISIVVTESSEQIVAGIPRTISVSTNIPSTIFYTLNGSDPDLFSDIYTIPLVMPTDLLSVTLKVFATNGVDYSPIVTEVYTTNILNNARYPHAATTAAPGENLPGLYPYGTNPIQPNAQYLSTADAGITVDNPVQPSTPTGFDGAGNPNAFTNQPYNIENYSIEYSTTDRYNQTGRGIGTLPATVSVEAPTPPPESTSQFTATFDPRAFVIFQDFDKENPNDPPQINRQYYSLEDPNRSRDGNYYFTTGQDSPPVSGNFLRSHYNPRDNTMTYYYLDTWTNKWIISKAPYQPTGSFNGNLASTTFARGSGAGKVFEWIPFTRRVLF